MITRSWLLYNCLRVIETRPQSPDLTIIENVWDILNIRVRQSPVMGKANLQTRLQKECAKISPEYLTNLVLSMSPQLQAVIDANGLHTKIFSLICDIVMHT